VISFISDFKGRHFEAKIGCSKLYQEFPSQPEIRWKHLFWQILEGFSHTDSHTGWKDQESEWETYRKHFSRPYSYSDPRKVNKASQAVSILGAMCGASFLIASTTQALGLEQAGKGLFKHDP